MLPYTTREDLVCLISDQNRKGCTCLTFLFTLANAECDNVKLENLRNIRKLYSTHCSSPINAFRCH